MSDTAETLGALLGGQVAIAPRSPALLAPGRRTLGFGELGDLVARTAQQLCASGLGPGDPIAVVLPNGPEMATAFLATASSTCCAPLNPAYREEDFAFYLEDLQARLLVVAAGVDSPARRVALRMDAFSPMEMFVRDDFDFLPDGRVFPRLGWFDRAVPYPVLEEDGTPWMTVTPNEINTIRPIAASCAARGGPTCPSSTSRSRLASTSRPTTA